MSGFVDVYYGYNSNQPAERSTALRNFDVNSSQFALNMLELVADKPVSTDTGRVGYHVALGFGQAMNLVNAGEFASPTIPGTPLLGPPGTITNFDQYLKEGYLEYLAPVGKGLQINVGKFVTPAGAEVIETKDNWNYSRGLLFSWAIPYFHFGMSGKYAFNSKFALTGYLMNGWNNSVDNNSGKTTGFTAAWTPNSKFGLIENYLVGPEQGNDNSDFRHLTDTVVTYNPNAKLSLMANYDYGHDRAQPAAPGITDDPSMVDRNSRIHQVRSQCHVGDRHSRRMVQGPQRVLNRYSAERRRIYAHSSAHAGEQDHGPAGVPPRHVGPGCFPVPHRVVPGFAEHRDPRHGLRIQQRRCQVARRQST